MSIQECLAASIIASARTGARSISNAPEPGGDDPFIPVGNPVMRTARVRYDFSMMKKGVSGSLAFSFFFLDLGFAPLLPRTLCTARLPDEKSDAGGLIFGIGLLYMCRTLWSEEPPDGLWGIETC